MAFTVVAWSESQDTSNVLTNVAALADQHVTVTGDDVKVPGFASNLIGVYAGGTTITQAQLSSPSLRAQNLKDVIPLNVGAEPTSPPGLSMFNEKPIKLVPAEALQSLVAENAAGAERENVVAFLQGEFKAAPNGEVRTVRATNGSTLIAFTWTLGALTFSQQLAAGRYAIVGMRAQSAGLLAARLVIPGSEYRPGCIGTDSEGDISHEVFRNGTLGNWGEFEHDTPPQVEFLSVSADTSQIVYLDLVKIA